MSDVTTQLDQPTPLKAKPNLIEQIIQWVWSGIPATWTTWAWSCVGMWLVASVYIGLMTCWSDIRSAGASFAYSDVWAREGVLRVGLYFIYSGPLVVLLKMAKTHQGTVSRMAWALFFLGYPFLAVFNTVRSMLNQQMASVTTIVPFWIDNIWK